MKLVSETDEDRELQREVRIQAAIDAVSMSDIAIAALKQYLAERDKPRRKR